MRAATILDLAENDVAEGAFVTLIVSLRATLPFGCSAQCDGSVGFTQDVARF
jgi:hypothetical protein